MGLKLSRHITFKERDDIHRDIAAWQEYRHGSSNDASTVIFPPFRSAKCHMNLVELSASLCRAADKAWLAWCRP